MSYTARRSIAAAIALLVAACGGAAQPRALEELELAELETYGCGYGFWLGTPEQDVAIRLGVADHEAVASGELAREATLPDEAWQATVQHGRDLFANWCDDVLEPGEPTPDVTEEWPITGGTITLEGGAVDQGCPGELSATLADLEVTAPDDTTIDLGSAEVTNDTWGCFAG
ncbi:MAG: hypothetical protein WD638_05380 [Nitriliruptoraceae bacterium]